MDRNIEEERNSLVIPVSLKRDGDFSKNSSVLEEEEIYGLINHVRNLQNYRAVSVSCFLNDIYKILEQYPLNF